MTTHSSTGEKMFKPILASALLILLFSNLTACSAGSESSGVDLSGVAQDNQVLSTTSTSDPDESQPIDEQNTCVLTVLDEAILKLVNETRALARMCGDTVYEPAPPVTWSCTLKKAALGHAVDMGENNFFSHTGSDGLRIGSRVDAVEYDWLMVGENIAVGFPTAQQVMTGWLASPGHCSTIMNKNYEQTATAVHLPQGSDYSIYWAMIMAEQPTI